MIGRRRRLPAAVLLAGVLALPMEPAGAVTPVVVHTMPSGWYPTLGGTPDAVGVSGPTGVPLGGGSLRVPPGFFDYDFMAPASTLDRWDASVLIPAERTLNLAIWTDTTPDSAPTSDETQADDALRTSIASAGQQWTGFDLSTQSWVLTHDNDMSVPAETLTWDAYRAANPDAVVTKIKMAFIGTRDAPTGPSFHYLDAMTFGSSEDPTTYDFEAAPEWSLQTSVQQPIVPFGATAGVSGQFTDPDGSPVAFQSVALFKKAGGENAYTLVPGTQAFTNGSGGVTTNVSPSKHTAYQWRPTDHYERNVVSTTSAVDVRRIITVNVSDPTINATTRLVVFGLTKSPAEGKTVTLRRTGSTRALGTTTVRSDGTYAFSRTMPKGSYSVYATIPASGGLLNGASQRIAVSVK